MKSNVVTLAPVRGGANVIRKVTSLDKMIGEALRLERNAKCSSMEEVANAVGVTYQQIGKLEHGENRLSVARLLKIAEFLGFDPGVFVNDLRDDNDEISTKRALSKHLSTPGVLELILLFNALTHDKRRVVLALMRELAGDDGQA